MPEGWALEDETHRNNSFVLFNAYHLPRLSIGEAMVKKVGDHLWKVEVPVLNDRAIPSMTAVAVQNKLHRQDVATVTGGKVISSGLVDDPYLDKIEVQEHRPERLMVPGVDGALDPHPLLPGPGRRRHHRQLRQPEGGKGREEDRAPGAGGELKVFPAGSRRPGPRYIRRWSARQLRICFLMSS